MRVTSAVPVSVERSVQSAMPVGSLPALARGAHRGPDRGACLMEYTALLAGESFGDHPPCTHPAMAELARQVNDRIDAPAREALVTRAPALAAIGPDRSGVVTAVTTAVLLAHRQHATDSLLLLRRTRTAAELRERDRAARSRWSLRWDLLRLSQLTRAGLDGIERRALHPGVRSRLVVGVLDTALWLCPSVATGLSTVRGAGDPVNFGTGARPGECGRVGEETVGDTRALAGPSSGDDRHERDRR